MRHLVLIVMVAVLVVGIAGIVLAEPTADKTGTFSVEAASGWSQSEGDDLISFQGPNGIAQMSVVGDTAEGVTLTAFEKIYVSQAKQSLKKFKLISHARAKLDGVSAGLWVYTAVVDGVTLKFKNYVTFREGQMYNVVFATVPERYSKDVSGLDKMVRSWKWL